MPYSIINNRQDWSLMLELTLARTHHQIFKVVTLFYQSPFNYCEVSCSTVRYLPRWCKKWYNCNSVDQSINQYIFMHNCNGLKFAIFFRFIVPLMTMKQLKTRIKGMTFWRTFLIIIHCGDSGASDTYCDGGYVCSQGAYHIWKRKVV